MLAIEELKTQGYKFIVSNEVGQIVGRAFLYILKNDLHQEPFGYIEDVYLDELVRGKGKGKELINKIIATAQEKGCYKLIANCRNSKTGVHEFYKKLGFKDYGKEFRIDF